MGDIVMRILADDARPNEVRAFLKRLQGNQVFRDNCASLGMLMDDSLAASKRREMVDSLVTFLLYEIDPENEHPHGPHPGGWPRKGMAHLRQLLWERDTRWEGHALRANGEPRPVDTDKCYISEELWGLTKSLEDLVGLQGVYVDRTPGRSAEEHMADQLQKRGSISARKTPPKPISG